MPTNAIISDISALSKVLARTDSQIQIPFGITRLGTLCLYGFTSLTTLKLPKSLTFVAGNALSACGNITDIVLEDGFDCSLSIIGQSNLTEAVVQAMVAAYKNNALTGVTRTLTLASEVYDRLSAATILAATAKGLSIAVPSIK